MYVSLPSRSRDLLLSFAFAFPCAERWTWDREREESVDSQSSNLCASHLPLGQTTRSTHRYPLRQKEREPGVSMKGRQVQLSGTSHILFCGRNVNAAAACRGCRVAASLMSPGPGVGE